ncbi:MAG: phosphoenolpyruvate--protein phosphotransferase [Phycisphaerae bacterium]|nr:phosphoenolpyruvate--protein phosphotransferase [Phycisphaerae bacterium]
MDIIKGIAVSPGVAICTAMVLEAEDYQRISHRTIPPEKTRAEIHRLRKAFLDATTEVSGLQTAQAELWDSRIKDIFAVHLHFLRDRTLRRKIADLITQHNYSAEYAVSVILRDISKHFGQAKDRYISERASDIFDIEKRLLQHLMQERREEVQKLTEPVVVVAHDLTPTQTASFNTNIIKGIATDAGGRTSHTAIVARSLGIPAVVALGNATRNITIGDIVIVDGNHGTVVVNPDQATIEEYQGYAEAFTAREHKLDELAHLPAVTTDGHTIRLMGNIEFPSEAKTTLQRGGNGIGLYRTEFLYLDAAEEPIEEDHYNAYMETIRDFGDHPITIRTVDLGADKFTQARSAVPERNPFLGLRSIRYCLQNLPMFKAQMRAILRASVHGDVKMMFPLITSLLELRQAKWVLADVKEDLEEQGIPFNENIPVGVMIETPAAALIADELADEVDFFSIGTNDLIQYTLAVDRVNERVASLYSPMHPAILQLLRNIVKTANRARIELSLCGEMASEPEFTPLLVGLGFDTLSLANPMIPDIKKIIRSVSLEYCQAIALKVLQFDTSNQTSNFLREELRKIQAGEIENN